MKYLKKYWKLILIIIIGCILSYVLFFYLKKCDSNKCSKCEECPVCEQVKFEEKPDTSGDDITYPIEKQYIIDQVMYYGTPVSLNQDYLDNGYLNSDWYIEELKNTKFIGTAVVNVDIGPATIFALSEAGELYKIYNDFNEEPSYTKLSLNVSGKPTNLEYMYDKMFYSKGVPVLTINDNKCILTQDNETGDYVCDIDLEKEYEKYPIYELDLGENIYFIYKEKVEIVVLEQGIIGNLTDINTGEIVVPIYTIYNKAECSIFVISSDNKIYELPQNDGYMAEAIDEVIDIKYVERMYSKEMIITLKETGDIYISGELEEW